MTDLRRETGEVMELHGDRALWMVERDVVRVVH